MPIVYNSVGAGLYDGKVKLSDGNEFDIYAIISLIGDPSQDETEIKGDDTTLATFISNIREELKIEANGLSFDTIQAITGNSATSSATGIEIPLGTDSQKNPPFIEVQGFTKAKDTGNSAVTIQKIWHKVQIKSIKVTQEGEGEFKLEMTGVAYQTATDIEGAALATSRVSTLKVLY
jgi:hypothetical protein